MLLVLRAASDIPIGVGCPFLGFARNSGRGGTVTIIIAPLVLLYPERSRGVGIYTGVLVSASLDEQFMSGVDVCTLISIPLNRGFSDMNALSKVLRVIYRMS